MFKQLVPHRLLPLDAIWLFERGQIEPAVLFGTLLHDLTAIADQAIDHLEIGSEGPHLFQDRCRGIVRHDNVHRQSSCGAICRGGASSISCGGQRKLFGAELEGAGYRQAQTAVFERTGRVQAFILYPELLHPQAISGSRRIGERRPALTQLHLCRSVSYREDFLVTPEISIPARHGVRGKTVLDRVQVIARKERLPHRRKSNELLTFDLLSGTHALEVGRARQLIRIRHHLSLWLVEVFSTRTPE